MLWVDNMIYTELKTLHRIVEARMVEMERTKNSTPTGKSFKFKDQAPYFDEYVPVKQLPVPDTSTPARKTVHRCYEGPTLFELAEAQAKAKANLL